jgi:hypothetical protein
MCLELHYLVKCPNSKFTCTTCQSIFYFNKMSKSELTIAGSHDCIDILRERLMAFRD